MIIGTGLSNNFLAELMDDLGLSSFILSNDKKCSDTKAPFNTSVDGWNYGKDKIKEDKFLHERMIKMLYTKRYLCSRKLPL